MDCSNSARNRDDHYDPDLDKLKEANVFKLTCNHFCYTDGTELFSNKMFNISPAEAAPMDPQQRFLLECSKELTVTPSQGQDL